MIKRLMVIIAIVCLLGAIYCPNYEINTGLPDNIFGIDGNSYIFTHDLLVIFALAILATLLMGTLLGLMSCDFG